MQRLATVIVPLFLFSAAAFGQSNRTFVSAASGSDLNNCTRPSPCRSFGAALAVTNAGGEVVALDSGGYGPFTVSHAASVESPSGVYAGVTVTSGIGITVNAGLGDVVRLNGLTVVAMGTTIGVAYNSGSYLVVDGCAFYGGTDEIYMYTAGNLSVMHSTFVGASNSGVNVATPSQPAAAAIDASSFIDDAYGLYAHDGARVLLSNSLFNGCSSDGVFAYGGVTNAQVMIDGCRFAHNYEGVLAYGSGLVYGLVQIARSSITGSSNVGLHQFDSGVVNSMQNNAIESNNNDTSGTIGQFAGK